MQDIYKNNLYLNRLNSGVLEGFYAANAYKIRILCSF